MKRFKKLTALIATALLTTSIFAGCSNNSAGENGTINVFNWGEYIDESLIKDFENETGIKVNYSTYDTNEIMYQKIKTNPGTYDIVIPSDYMIEKMIKEDLLEKIDFNNIPNYKYIGEKFKNLPYDPTNEYSVPYTWGTVGIIYDSTVVTEPVTSWDILWNEKYKDNVYMYNSLRDSLAITLVKNGYSLNSTNADEINVAKEDLLKQLTLTNPIYVIDEVRDNMISGEKALAVVYSGDASYIMSQNPDMKYVVPNEGSNKWFDAIAIPKDAPNKAGAEAFINFLCDPENAKTNIEYIEYSTPNTGAFELLDDEVKNNPAAYPSDAVLERCEVFTDLDPQTLKLYESAFTEILSQ
ncbi:PotD/PotF family extracellular solute-binding protein [Clostridium celatum]|nr:ABC transporter substrate-binding protein [Clostridium celatum]MCE9653983.1 ABC transporter substrate-binding protein [Clostridium celatum]MDU2264979.1 ABC transporter substrate-binding protein [Clostridium celatum]MDU3722396.1 ABC transporter substrate-binding protein [Clostridium celatum]MDU6294343.1 ABC transporter substrate-binding protein [Clostridium celatum]MDY3359804.1 ABC transporter substrate-binding protein [Clostridium celatum]